MSATPGAPWKSIKPEDLVGQVFAGRFELVRMLGAGGMGAVFEATQIALGRRVAVKVLNPQLARDRNHVERFRREAQAASNLRHRNIVDVIDFGEAGDLVFYAMEYLEGEDLSALLARVGRMRWAEARPLLLQVVRALRAAHDKGVIHRDVKPANVFLIADDDGARQVKVLDFGIAKVLAVGDGQTLTRSDELFGSVKYMAPEQADGRSVDARTDVYAVGVLAYRMMTGQVPFEDDNAFRVLMRHQSEPPVPPRSRDPDVPEAVEQLILRALAKAPEDRYPSMAGLETALVALAPLATDGAATVPQTVSDPTMMLPGGAAAVRRMEDATELLPAQAARPRDPTAPAEPPTAPALLVPDFATAALPSPAGGAPRVDPAPTSPADVVHASVAPRHDETLFAVQKRPPALFFAVLAMVVIALGAVIVRVVGTLDDGAGSVEPAKAAVVRPPLERPTVETDRAHVEQSGPALVPTSALHSETTTGEQASALREPTEIPVPVEPAPTAHPPTRNATASTRKPSHPRASEKLPIPAMESDDSLVIRLTRQAKQSCAGLAGDRVRVKIQVRQGGGVLLARADDPHTHTALGKCVAKVAATGNFGGTGNNRSISMAVEY